MRKTSIKAMAAAATVVMMLTGCGVNEEERDTTQITTVQAETTQAETTQAETTQTETTQVETTQAETTQAETTQAESTDQTTENADTTGNTDTEQQASDDEEWKTEFEKDLMENYGVAPDHYEYLGDNLYQVYVEIDGKVVPYVIVNSVTGDYHG